MTILKSYQSLKIETKRESIKKILIRREIDLRIPGELSKEQELQNDIEKMHTSTSEALENSWDMILFIQNQNNTIRKK